MGSVSAAGGVSEAVSNVCLRTITFSNMVSSDSSSLHSFYKHKEFAECKDSSGFYLVKNLHDTVCVHLLYRNLFL